MSLRPARPRIAWRGTRLFAALACALAASDVVRGLDVMPAPQSTRVASGALRVTETFGIALTGHTDARLRDAVDRAMQRWSARTGLRLPAPSASAGEAALSVWCGGPGAAVPALGEDESYRLEITPAHAELRAATTAGAMHGLETLLQLLTQDRDGYSLPAVVIEDRPRFPWRGLMIDVARHWQPVAVIKRNLDAMAVVKLNVLHLHLTDHQGFRIESKRYPELTAKGSDGLFFTQDQIRDIIAYAAARGIRVVPEIDLPGHTQALAVAHPEFTGDPGPYTILRTFGTGSPVALDPTNEDLYRFLDGFLGEMAGLFPDAYLHIGGDEVNGKQWSANPRIQAFIRERGLKDNAGLQAYFDQRLFEILRRHGKRMIGWDEIQHAGLPADVVIHSWRGPKSLMAAVQHGYTAILSNGYYLDLIQPAARHYRVDPLPADTPLSADEQRRVLGGEATMWSEWVSAETIDSRVWPRAAAIAERLWSPRDVTDVPEMYRRLAIVSLRLEEAGADHERNFEPMLRRLAGIPLTLAELGALRAFVDAVEPLKGYRRGRNQKGVTQATPLTGVVDCARPESAVAREFSHDVEQFLAGRPDDRAEALARIETQLRAWDEAARRVRDELLPRVPRLQVASPLILALGDVARTGLRAVGALRSGQASTASWTTEQLALLERAGEPGPAAVELPMLSAVRLLVVAAAEQTRRAALSPEEWARSVHDKGQPPKPRDG